MDGPTLLTVALFPSPWSEAAKGVFQAKGLPISVVRYRANDPELVAWSGAENAPVLLCKGEPRRTGWAEIVMRAERMGGASLVPAAAADRQRMFGMGHEIAGEGGLGWCARLLMIHGAFATNGAEGFPLPVAQFLGAKYGYSEEQVGPARHRIAEVLQALDSLVEDSRARGQVYLLGNRLSALDIQLATFLTPLVGSIESECPGLSPKLVPAIRYLQRDVGAAVTPALRAHRSLVFERHLASPIML